jgi:hypothetical protein
MISQYFTGPVKISEGFRSGKRKTQAHGHVFRFEIDPSRYCTSLESAVASLVYFFLLLFFCYFFGKGGSPDAKIDIAILETSR